MQRDFFGNLIFAIIARILCGSHLNTVKKHWLGSKPSSKTSCWKKYYPKARMSISNAALRNSVGTFRGTAGRDSRVTP